MALVLAVAPRAKGDEPDLAREEHALHKLDRGYTWLVNPHTQLDASLGVGLSASAPDFFVEVGFCRRF